MRLLLLIAAVSLIGALAACGDSGSGAQTTTGETESESRLAKAIAERPKPKVRVPKGPAPKQLVVKDLQRGSGPAAEDGDRLSIHDVGVFYKSGQQFNALWQPGSTYKLTLGAGNVLQGWEKGLVGMRVGGRRELIIPSNLAFGNGPVIYVVDLVAIE